MANSGFDHQLTIIIPTLNEFENIDLMLTRLLSIYPNVSILVVDDGSVDGTIEVINEWNLKNSKVQLLNRSQKEMKGLTISLVEAIENITTQFFFIIDCDFQHPPEQISDGLKLLTEGNMLVIGVRHQIKDWGLMRKIISWGAKILGNLSLFIRGKSRPHDITSGFFGGKTSFIQDILKKNPNTISPRGYKLLFDILKVLPRQTPIGEFYYIFQNRRLGKSKIGMSQIITFFRSLF